MALQTDHPISRRSALAGLGAGGLGLALTNAVHPANAQDASPTALASHPFVGTWIVDRDPNDPTEIPTYNVVTSDGTIIDPTVGGVGVWEATGPNTANFTLTGTIIELNAYFLVRSSITIDADGGYATNNYSSTIVAADGTVMEDLTSAGDTANYIRLLLEPVDATGPLPEFPAWTPAPPSAATPTA